MSDLDGAHRAMQAGGEAEALAFWRALADAELFLVLEREAEGETLSPRVYDLSEGRLLLAYDSEERLAAISDVALPYAALPGRVIAGQMAGQGLGLGLNLGTGAGSETVLPPEAVDWLARMLTLAPPEERVARAAGFRTPALPPGLQAALAALPLPAEAALAGVDYEDGGRGHVLALQGVPASEEARIARAVTEALAFSGLDAAALDVVFLSDPAAWARVAAAGVTFRPAPPPARPVPPPKAPPGMDPEKPPRLR